MATGAAAGSGSAGNGSAFPPDRNRAPNKGLKSGSIYQWETCLHHPENLWALEMNCLPLPPLLPLELPQWKLAVKVSLFEALVTSQLPLPQVRARLLFYRLALEVPQLLQVKGRLAAKVPLEVLELLPSLLTLAKVALLA